LIFLLDKETTKIPSASKITLVLTPSLYWSIKERLDVSLKEARSLAPSLFEGLLPKDEKFSYWVEKRGDEYLFFAYNPKKILKKFKELGIEEQQIQKVFFIHQFPLQLQGGIEVASNRILTMVDGDFVVVPKRLFEGELLSLPSHLPLPKKAIPLLEGQWYENRTFYPLMILLFLFIVAFSFYGFFLKKDIAALKEQREALFIRYHLPKTSFELRNILGSLEKEHKRQLRLRKEIAAFTKIPLQKGEYMQYLTIEPKKSRVVFHIEDKERASFIKEQVAKICSLERAKLSGKQLELECR